MAPSSVPSRAPAYSARRKDPCSSTIVTAMASARASLKTLQRHGVMRAAITGNGVRSSAWRSIASGDHCGCGSPRTS